MEFVCNSSSLWDYNLTWNKASPDFTRCFQQTVAIWIPCGFLWIATPYELYQQVHSSSHNIPWNFKNITKCVATVSLMILSIMIVIHDVIVDLKFPVDGEFSYRALVFTPIFLSGTYILSIYLVIRGRHHGIRSSGSLFLFWLLLTISMTIALRSSIINMNDKEKHDFVKLLISIGVFTLALLQLFVASFADDRPTHENIEYKEDEKVCPEPTSSVLSQLIYSWMTPLITLGYRMPLSLHDIWTLTSDYRCNRVSEYFESYWNKTVKITNRMTHRKRKSIGLELLKAFWPSLFAGFVYRLLHDILILLNPQLLNLLINYISSSSDPHWKGLFYAVALFISAELQSLFVGRHYFHQFTAAIQIHGALVSAIYKKVENMKMKDQRIGLIKESLKGIKVLKLYAWEIPFMQKVTDIREKEIDLLRKIALLNALMRLSWTICPFIVALLTFGTFVFIDDDNILTPNIVFVSLSLLNIIQFSLRITPDTISFLVRAYVSMNRINEFMFAAEVEGIGISQDDKCAGENDIVLSNCTFCWSKRESRMGKGILKNINLKIKRGSLVAVIGQVGSGKTSLISAILGEMVNCKGYVNVHGSVSYVPQLAWIRNSTVKDNILMYKGHVKSTYECIIDRCDLRKDLDILPGGDQSEIGDMGINLSGGQKQRISLARAVYHDADIYLLDDPLSAVDSYVGKHIFDQVIGPNGILNTKTRVFATHGLSYLPYCDVIVFMKDGTINEICDYEKRTRSKQIFEDIAHAVNDEIYNDGNPNNNMTLQNSNVISRNKVESERTRDDGLSDFNERSSLLAHGSERKSRKSNIICSESVQVGRVGQSVYNGYLRSIGYATVIFILVTKICAEGFLAGSNVWLSKWSSDSYNNSLKYVGLEIYGGLAAGQAFFAALATFGLVYVTMNSAKSLHDKMLKSVMRSPMWFFDTTPIGRIINRLSEDFSVIDLDLIGKADDILNSILQIVFTIIVISINIPIFLAFMIPIVIIFYLIQKVYVLSSTQLRRLESVTRSPLFDQFSESLTGTFSIRAYGLQSRFIDEFSNNVDTNHRCFFSIVMANRWLSVRLEFIANCVILFTALFAVYNRETIDAGTVGLTVSYAMNMTTELLWIVRTMSDLEINMVSVERILEYCNLTDEAPWNIAENKLQHRWPKDGRVEFHSYSVKYRNEFDLVLANINCCINAGEKIGICGRTGAGKSTLMLGLFRLLEASDGSIFIDGVNISNIGLHDLRAKLTVVPQDPVLFAGNLRFNLDPFSNFSDDQIWKVLEHAHLKHFVSTLDAGLMYEIGEGGENLSVGQRQLVCLARALLRKTKIILLDEATAATDLQTDRLIQEIVKREFSDCTVLTIAHRLTTIMDSTRVMVLDSGRVIEFDSPSKLIENRNSSFYQMVEDNGLI
ncbi:ABCC2 (predicted) [Pycnogonum litorale]